MVTLSAVNITSLVMKWMVLRWIGNLRMVKLRFIHIEEYKPIAYALSQRPNKQDGLELSSPTSPTSKVDASSMRFYSMGEWSWDSKANVHYKHRFTKSQNLS